MSFKVLPTELDERILSFSAGKDLSTISRISKYYNKIAEPHLYRRVVFASNQNYKARRLLLRLLLRPDLASHIKEVEVTKSQRPRPTREQWSDNTHSLETALSSLQSSITALIGRHHAKSGIRMAWLASILALDYLEGTIALIACIATNMELLSYTTGLTVDNRHCPLFLSQILAEVASLQAVSKRLTKLSKLALQSMGHVELPRLPSLEFIKIADSREVTFPQYNHLPIATNLRKIEILHSFGHTFLPNFLHRDRVPHLKKLIFRDRWGGPGANYQQIVDKLKTECPGLNYLKLTIESPYQGVPITVAPLKGLQYLTELTTLCIDMAFHLENSRHTELLSMGPKLLPKLMRLELNHVNFTYIESIMSLGKVRSYQLRPFFAGGPPVRHFSFSIDNSYVSSDDVVKMLTTIANALLARPCNLQIWRAPVRGSTERGLQAMISRRPRSQTTASIT